MRFTKYHALGNDYIVINPNDSDTIMSVDAIRALCDRHYGIGSDGVLYGPCKSTTCDFGLKIFNPDGSEAEKSGNGLRIFSRYLWDFGLVSNDKFSIETKGGEVKAQIFEEGKQVSVEMGKVRFTHDHEGTPKIQRRTITAMDKTFEFYTANVGNPHCVILVEELSPVLAMTYGKIIEQDGLFKARTNVQFMKVIDRNTVEIEIWERGAGYTLASGSSSTACAAVAYELGLCDAEISVHMPGGALQISLQRQSSMPILASPNAAIDTAIHSTIHSTIHFTIYATMKGPVCKIADGVVSRETLESI